MYKNNNHYIDSGFTNNPNISNNDNYGFISRKTNEEKRKRLFTSKKAILYFLGFLGTVIVCSTVLGLIPVYLSKSGEFNPINK